MQWAIAEWDYTATHEDELVRDNRKHAQWEGDCNGLSGVFPANRCRLLSAAQTVQDATLEHEDRNRNQQQHHHDHDQEQQQAQDQMEYLIDHDSEALQGPHDIAPHGSQISQEKQQRQTASSHATMSSPLMDNSNSAQIHSPPPEPTDSLSDSEQVVLPPNWSATTNSNGRLYYYNVMTKETSWKMPTAVAVASPPLGSIMPSAEHYSDHGNVHHDNHTTEVLSHEKDYAADEESLPEGWNAARDEGGSQYFFNTSTGETTWDRPMSPALQRNQRQSEPIIVTAESSRAHQSTLSPIVRSPTPKRQASVDETILQSQLLDLSLSDEELHVLELNQLPTENIQRKGSLRVKSQKVSTNATISSWKDYWVVVYKGFLLFYRDESGAIKNAHSLKSSTDSMNRLRQVTQVKPSGCFDCEKVAAEVPVNGQALTKKKNFFYITPGASVRLLLQDASGGDEKAWVKDIKTSLASRQADELPGSEEPYLIQVLKRQTAGSGEASGFKMNKKIEGKDLKTINKSPLKMDKARGIRSMVAQGIHVPRRKSAQDERLRLPAEEEPYHSHHTQNNEPQRSDPHLRHSTTASTAGAPATTATATNNHGSRQFSNPKRKSSRDQNNQGSSSPFKKDQDTHASDYGSAEAGQDVGSPGSSSSHQGAKAKLTNMSRNFFSKDRDKEKERERDRDKDRDREREREREKEREKEKDRERQKDRSKDKAKDKYKEKGLRKEAVDPKAAQGGSVVFGGSLVVEAGRTVPMVVELCIKAIEARGLATAGIYRVSGHMASIQNLKRAFNEGANDIARLVEKEPDINTIAALLKLYFRELREPLMLFDFYPSFIAAADISDYNEKLYTIKSLVHSLPEPNFSTLQYLMMHLGRIQDQYHTTKMDSANLAICFAPNLLRQEVNDLTSIINTGKQSSIIDTLIEQREWVFDPYPEDDEEEVPVEGEEGSTAGAKEDDDEQLQESSMPQEHYHESGQHETLQTDDDNHHHPQETQHDGTHNAIPPPPYVEGDEILAQRHQHGDRKGPLDP
ncbi:Rho GTPase-activating protein 21 [Gamsiella multidivaricata]|nr:Rho GTPase-activating protein 21 [Gamsiella multidivaricata]